MKIKHFTLLLMGMFFAACSNDDQPSKNDQETDGLVFEISTVAELDTRAGAPVYSQEATQNVTRVTIYAFAASGTDYKFVKSYDVSGWTAGTTFKRYPVPDAEKLTAGDYKFLVVGRDGTDLYTLTDPVANTTKIEDMMASVNTSGEEYELFAGMVQGTVLEKGTRVSITMNRKVAGIMGYFKNIPQILDNKTVKYLRLTANASNTQVGLTTGTGSNTAATSYNIINMDISNQQVQNEIYTGNDLSAVGVAKLPNSQLNGAFMIPVNSIQLTLGLYDEQGTAIKTWPVTDNGATTFNIVANNFYSLGTKYKAGTTTGNDPQDPGDDDDAIDLLQDQTITITIDPTWGPVHPLVLQQTTP